MSKASKRAVVANGAQTDFRGSRRWHQDTKSIHALFHDAVVNQHFIRVAALLFLNDEAEPAKFQLIGRQGREAAEQHLIGEGYGVPRGKMPFADLQAVVSSPAQVISIALQTVKAELREEIGLKANEIEYVCPGPLLLNDRAYKVEHYPKWKFPGLGYDTPARGAHDHCGERCYAVHCSACLYLICSTDRMIFLKRDRSLASTEGRHTGVVNIEDRSRLSMLRSRQQPAVLRYRDYVKERGEADCVIRLGE